MAGPRILIVEDEGIVAKDIQATLERLGYRVVATAASGEEALRQAHTARPDLVLMDIVLKGQIDGIEAARRIREGLDVPVVYLTAYADGATLERAKVTEPFGYILKPFEDRELHIVIEMALHKHQLERQLIAAKEKAEEVSRLKSSLLSNMSHEIRTPLAGIIGFASCLAQTVDGENREMVRLIEQSGRRLLETLNSVLALSQLEGGGVTLNLEVLNIEEEVRNVLSMFESLAEQKGLAFSVGFSRPHIMARLDCGCLHRIVSNLLVNAVKFTEQGAIMVQVGADAQEMFISVHDTGIGIDETFLPHVFDEFRQESSGLTRSYDGNGLGLAITKRLVTLMGGSISVESQKGRGSVFTVSFPGVIPEAAKSTPKVSGQDQRSQTNGRPATTSSPKRQLDTPREQEGV